MENKQLRKVTLVGATGNIGKAITEGLLAAGHQVTVITRPDSTAALPSTATVHRADYIDEASLADMLKGQEVLITALSFFAYEAQRPLFRAAAKAGVPWIVPCEFGSDPHAPLNEHINLMNAKATYRALVEDLGTSSWLGVVNNPWFDYMMRAPGGLGVDLRTRTATLYDGHGGAKAVLTTMRRVGQSLAAVLALPEPELAQYRNGWVFFGSFRATQRDIWESAMRATGTAEGDWAVETPSSAEVIKQCKEAMASGARMVPALLVALTFAEGMGGDYQDKVVDYKRLGLEPDESLDEAVKELVNGIVE